MYIVYSKPNCSYCTSAKALLDQKNKPYVEIMIDVGQTKDLMKQYISLSDLKLIAPNVKTAPAILKDGIFIGGFVELQKQL